jgi:hypothetical protein
MILREKGREKERLVLRVLKLMEQYAVQKWLEKVCVRVCVCV